MVVLTGISKTSRHHHDKRTGTTWELSAEDPEVLKVKVNATTATALTPLPEHFRKFSSWTRLCKAIANLSSMAARKKWEQEALGIQGIERAEKLIIKVTQQEWSLREVQPSSIQRKAAAANGTVTQGEIRAITPYTFVGMDAFGPFIVKDRRTEIKIWGLIFTCLYTRAVHLEVLDDLSTGCFINALRNLIAIRRLY